MIPVLALASDEAILEIIPPLLVKNKMITVKAIPVKNMTSIILTEKNDAMRYVVISSIIKATVNVTRNFLFTNFPPTRNLF